MAMEHKAEDKRRQREDEEEVQRKQQEEETQRKEAEDQPPCCPRFKERAHRYDNTDERRVKFKNDAPAYKVQE